jgi:hypothetical protein
MTARCFTFDSGLVHRCTLPAVTSLRAAPAHHAAVAAAHAGTLAFTGADLFGVALFGAALAAVGGWLTWAARWGQAS